MLFQSTQPMRAATLGINPALHSGRISIHAAHAGCDSMASKIFMLPARFQSTQPMRAATYVKIFYQHSWQISIHAAHAGCDSPPTKTTYNAGEFQSTQPMRAATRLFTLLAIALIFQSTQPMRAATSSVLPSPTVVSISIHAAHAGCDPWHLRSLYCRQDFNPRSPCGLRPERCHCLSRNLYFNPRSPCGLRQHSSYCAFPLSNFNPRSPCGLRLQCAFRVAYRVLISIHAAHAGCDGNLWHLIFSL